MFSNIRFWVLVITFLIAGFVYLIRMGDITSLVRYYGLLALGYLYLTLMASPTARFFTWFPWRGQYLKARRALGVSTALFANLHGNLVIFKIYGGPQEIFALPLEYQWPLWLGLSSMLILLFMSFTSFDWVADKMGFARWKAFHRLVYYVGVAVVIHAFYMGTHLRGFAHPISWLYAGAGVLLGILELMRLVNYIKGKSSQTPSVPPQNTVV